MTTKTLSLKSALFGILVASALTLGVSSEAKADPCHGGYAQHPQAAPVYVPPAPVYQQPVYQQPVYQQPVYQQPVYQQPAYGSGSGYGHRRPVFVPPVYHRPVVRHHHRRWW